ncbi:MAG: acyl-CoA dehydrogenase family protein [Mycobacterium sp.]
MTSPLAGGVFGAGADDDYSELRQLVDELGGKAFNARLGDQRLPQVFDIALWSDLESTGLTRLTTTPDLEAGPVESAILLRGLARHAAAVPIAETDLLAAGLAERAGVMVPETGPLTVATAEVDVSDGRLRGTAHRVPWAGDSVAVVLAANAGNTFYVAVLTDPTITVDFNLAGEPRDSIDVDLPVDQFVAVDQAVLAELTIRGAWARCVQIIGVLDAAAEMTVAHTREREQFGRSLSKFQAVQHSLAAMAGEIERARAIVTLAVFAANEHGFDHPATDYAVSVSKAALGDIVSRVVGIAHQLHGAIGVTIEHPLWLATMRARSWVDDFGTPTHYARKVGRNALGAALDADAWATITGARFVG